MINQVKLGMTDLYVSKLGLGTPKFGRNLGMKYPSPFALPEDKDIETLLAEAQEMGINLIDTAPAYGLAEERLGKLLKNRKEWILCTKGGEEFIDGKSYYDFSKRAIQLSLERSLRRLKTDYIDIFLIHSHGDDCKIIHEDEVFATLSDLKQQGLIRASGMSTKTLAGGILTLQHADVAMVTYNPLEREEQAVIQHAAQHQKGILIKKALASGHLAKIPGGNPIKTCMDFVAREKGVSSVIIGTLNRKHLKEISLLLET